MNDCASSSINRKKYLDIAKGIGIILVMLSHSCGFPVGGKFLTACYMPLFFIISGYFYKHGGTIKENIRRRFLRLMQPYIIFNILLLFLYSLFNVIRGKFYWTYYFNAIIGVVYSRYCLYYPLGIDNNVYFLQSDNSPMWFLTAMIVASMIFYMIIEKCLKNSKILKSSLITLFLMTCVFSKLPILLPWSLDTSFIGAFFMIIGAILNSSRYFERKVTKKHICLLVMLLALYLILCYFNPGINMSVRNYGVHGYFSIVLFIAIGVSGSVLCIWCSKVIEYKKIGYFLTIIGKNTIILLSLHLIIFEFIDAIVYKLFMLNTSNEIIYWTYGLGKNLLTIVICVILSELYQHQPFGPRKHPWGQCHQLSIFYTLNIILLRVLFSIYIHKCIIKI
jgi:fucose 4-O-acetylase-like acetyltransferase